MSKNVLGSDLELCCEDPVTGFYRTGRCETGPDDRGMHTVCVEITDDFLEFSKSVGNDLSTPMPMYAFPGLKAGDHWCVVLSRWIEAYDAGKAPHIYLKATHISVLEFIDAEVLNRYALDGQIDTDIG